MWGGGVGVPGGVRWESRRGGGGVTMQKCRVCMALCEALLSVLTVFWPGLVARVLFLCCDVSAIDCPARRLRVI